MVSVDGDWYQVTIYKRCTFLSGAVPVRVPS